MSLQEITLGKLDPEAFIEEQVSALRNAVGGDIAINALSGGVDSAAVTMLGHKALGEQLKTYFVENGLMREGEAEQIVQWFADLGVNLNTVSRAYRDLEKSGLVATTRGRGTTVAAATFTPPA